MHTRHAHTSGMLHFIAYTHILQYFICVSVRTRAKGIV